MYFLRIEFSAAQVHLKDQLPILLLVRRDGVQMTLFADRNWRRRRGRCDFFIIKYGKSVPRPRYRGGGLFLRYYTHTPCIPGLQVLLLNVRDLFAGATGSDL